MARPCCAAPSVGTPRTRARSTSAEHAGPGAGGGWVGALSAGNLTTSRMQGVAVTAGSARRRRTLALVVSLPVALVPLLICGALPAAHPAAQRLGTAREGKGGVHPGIIRGVA